MTYDAWKTRDDSFDGDEDRYGDEPIDDCWHHDDYDADILTGRATCNMCGHSWWMTDREVATEIEHMRAYDEWQREQHRPWNRFREWLRGHMPRWPRWPQRRRRAPEINDEIPF